MQKVRTEQDQEELADQESAPSSTCAELQFETDLGSSFPVTEPELKAIVRLLGSELDVILGLLR
jgi:hypothetical protein